MKHAYRVLFFTCYFLVLLGFTPAQSTTVHKSYDTICTTYGRDRETGEEICIESIESGNLPIDGSYETLALPYSLKGWKLTWANKNIASGATQTTHEYLPQGENLKTWQSMITSQFHTGENINTLAGLLDYFDNSAKQNQAIFHVFQNTPDWICAATYNPRNHVEFIVSATRSTKGLHILLYETKKDMSKEERDAVLKHYFSSRPALLENSKAY